MEYDGEMCQFHRTANLITSYAISNSKFVQINLRNSEILSAIDRYGTRNTCAGQIRKQNTDWKIFIL